MSADELCWSSARELSGRLARREISAVELVDAHLDRIERLDGEVNAVPTLVPGIARAGGRVRPASGRGAPARPARRVADPAQGHPRDRRDPHHARLAAVRRARAGGR